MEDLKELIIQTLDAAGVLDKIRAQLRLQVFKAVQNDEGKLQNENSKPVKIAQNPEGILAAALFRDFLECYKMKYSLNVLIPEFHLPQNQDVRAFLAKELKFTPEAGEPYLSFMLGFLIKSPNVLGKNAKEEEKLREKDFFDTIPESKPKFAEEPRTIEKKALPKIPEFKKPVEEVKAPEKKVLANIPEFKGKPKEEEVKPKTVIPEFKQKGPEVENKSKQLEEPKKLSNIPDFKNKPKEEEKVVKQDPKAPEKKTLANIPEFKGKVEEKLPEKKPLANIPEFKGKPVEEKVPEKKPLANIPEFKGKASEPEKKTIPEIKGKPAEEPKRVQQVPDNKGKGKEEIPSAKPLAIPEFKGKGQQEEPPRSLKHQELPNPKEDKSKKVQVQGKGKVPQILLPEIDSPNSSDRFEESNEKDAIDDVKKRLHNYGNYIEEMNEDISSKKFEFDHYGDSDEYEEEEEESGEYYAELSDDPSMHDEYLEDYDLIEDAEIVQSEDEEEGSSNS